MRSSSASRSLREGRLAAASEAWATSANWRCIMRSSSTWRPSGPLRRSSFISSDKPWLHCASDLTIQSRHIARGLTAFQSIVSIVRAPGVQAWAAASAPGFRMVRPRMRPARRSSRACVAVDSGCVASGRPGSTPLRAIAISSCISCRLPT